MALTSIACACLFAAVADAQLQPRSARYDWRAAAAVLDRDYDACLALDQRVAFLAEWAPSGAFAAVTVEEPKNDPKLEKCLAGLLRATRIPAFAGPLTAKMRKVASRTDCVVISVRSDKPIPIFVNGVAVGTTPVDYRTKRGDYLVTWTTTNGFAMSERVRRSGSEDCGRTHFTARSWIDPALMVPSTSGGP